MLVFCIYHVNIAVCSICTLRRISIPYISIVNGNGAWSRLQVSTSVDPIDEVTHMVYAKYKYMVYAKYTWYMQIRYVEMT